MTAQSKWLLFAGLIAAFGGALYLGVSPIILLIVGFVLLCPLAMYFGMGRMHKKPGAAGHNEMSGSSSERTPERKTKDEMRGKSRMK